MGLIKAAAGSLGGILADQWREYFYCDAMPVDVLVTKGIKRTSNRSSNTKGVDNIISNGSVIAVADGQCMIIVEQGKVVDICAEPGEFVYDSSTEPSIFYGGLGRSILDTFKNIGKRFSFGGEAPKDQRVYYFNTKEILDNKFGTPTPILFEIVNKQINMRRTVSLRFNGIYSYIISDPILFYTRLCGNVESQYTRAQIDGQLKAAFIDALQPAVGTLAEQELRPAQIPSKARELKNAMNAELSGEWGQRGVTIQDIALNPIALTDEDLKKIQEFEDAATLGSSPQMMAGRMTEGTISAMNTAAGNSAGAVNGFMGLGMMGGMGNMGGFAVAQNMYGMVQQQPQQPAADGWTCTCGAVNTGKFCPECGSSKPAAGWICSCGAVNQGKFCPECGAKKPQSKCEKCGWEPEPGSNPPKFCPNCGDPF